MSRGLKTYRALAYTTAVLLIVLVFVAVPLDLAGHPLLGTVLGIAHGYLYIAYVVTTLWLSLKQRWPILKTLLVALAGTVPFAAFFAERRVVADAAARERGLSTVGDAPAA